MSNFTLTASSNITKVLNRFLHAPEAAARAVAQTALDVRDVLADATPVDTGKTAEAWQVTKQATLGDPSAIVSNHSVIMVYLEYGTPPHKITAKNGKALAFTPVVGQTTAAHKAGAGRNLYRSAKTGKAILSPKGAATVLVQSVNHPGTKPTFTVRSRLPLFAKMLNDNLRKEVARLIRG